MALTPEQRKRFSDVKLGSKNPMYGKHFTLEQRKRISDAKKKQNNNYSGKNNGNWKGGISNSPYGREFNKELKKLIRERDLYRCQSCFMSEKDTQSIKSNNRALDIHHIDYNPLNNSPDNLISLCHSCHLKIHALKRKVYI